MRLALLLSALLLAQPVLARDDVQRKREAVHPPNAMQSVSDKRVEAPSASAGSTAAPSAGWGPLGFRSGWVSPEWAGPQKAKSRKPRR